MGNGSSIRPDLEELICENCGGKYILRSCDRIWRYGKQINVKNYCFSCEKAETTLVKQKMEQEAAGEWKKKSEDEKNCFNDQLKEWNVVLIDEVVPKNEKVLYILGNGFDLMHGVQSRYSDFRDWLGEDSDLRSALENYWELGTGIWSEFEEGLAKPDVQRLGSKGALANELDNVGAYNDFWDEEKINVATKKAVEPMSLVASTLSNEITKWAKMLSVRTKDRPLRKMFKNGRVLCFNYTEFVEELYGVLQDNVCYIHGSRRTGEPLIIGHEPEASEEPYQLEKDPLYRERDQENRFVIERAQDKALLKEIPENDDKLTKKSFNIIKKHKGFFDSLYDVETVIVIGHSYAMSDQEYFREIAEVVYGKKVQWYFGCYNLCDLKRLKKLLCELGIPCERVTVFRTDSICAKIQENLTRTTPNSPSKRCEREISTDQKWQVEKEGSKLTIVYIESGQSIYKAEFSAKIGRVFFLPSRDCLLVMFYGSRAGILLLSCIDDEWHCVNEFEPLPDQRSVFSELQQILVQKWRIVFVYKNHVKRYKLPTGELTYNKEVKNAVKHKYVGTDIIERISIQ